MRSFTPVPPRASVLTLCVQLCVAFFLVSSAQAQSPAAQSPSPSPATISSWSGSISTGYLAVVFGLAFVLVSFTFCTSYCIRVWFVRRAGARGDDAAGADGQDGENSNEPPPPPGPPPVLVIQPDRAISCASIADEQLQEELARKFSLASRDSSRFVEIMLDQDENGELQVKPSVTSDEAAAAAVPAAQQGWFSRVFRACFRRPAPAAESTQQDDLEMGVVSRGVSSTRSSFTHTGAARGSVTRGGRRRSALQQGVVEEEVPGTLQVQWSGPSVSELRRETQPSEAVLAAARSVGTSVATSVSSTEQDRSPT